MTETAVPTTAYDEPVAVPELLAMPLRQRMPLLRRDPQTRERFRTDQREWSAWADARYRACAELRLDADPRRVRLGVKDTVDVAGFATRLGLRRYRHHPRHSAELLRAPALETQAHVTAKVVTTELNIGVGSGCVNPAFPQIGPAGSSTGSGVAVAAGICDLSLGTDVLGSVRWPAGRCGVVGLRTTHRTEALAGIFPLSPAMDAPGWVARTADDLAWCWDELRLGQPVPGSGRRRIGVLREVLDGPIEAPVAATLAASREAAAAAGHEVTEVSAGELWRWRAAAWDLCARDAWDGFQEWGRLIDEELLDSTRRALESGAAVPADRAEEIRRAMRRQRSAIGSVFGAQRIDAWLLPLDPTTPRALAGLTRPASTIPAPGDPEYEFEVGYTPLASFAGLPAVTFPMGRIDEPDAPIAMQLLGPPDSEHVLIRLAADLAAARGLTPFPPR